MHWDGRRETEQSLTQALWQGIGVVKDEAGIAFAVEGAIRVDTVGVGGAVVATRLPPQRAFVTICPKTHVRKVTVMNLAQPTRAQLPCRKLIHNNTSTFSNSYKKAVVVCLILVNLHL